MHYRSRMFSRRHYCADCVRFHWPPCEPHHVVACPDCPSRLIGLGERRLATPVVCTDHPPSCLPVCFICTASEDHHSYVCGGMCNHCGYAYDECGECSRCTPSDYHGYDCDCETCCPDNNDVLDDYLDEEPD